MIVRHKKPTRIFPRTIRPLSKSPIMRKLIIFLHSTLDGFVAGPKGEMDWIKVDETIFDYAGHRVQTADTAVYGRVTYQMMDAYWPTAADQPGASKHDLEHAEWYKRVTKVVVSHSLDVTGKPRTQVIRENVAAEIRKLKQVPGQDILMFGSPSIVHLLTQAGLVDDFWLFVNPVLLGQGIPLFQGLTTKTTLTLVESRSFANGVVCLHYENKPAG
jgi:dihydrofolate reductase